MHRRLDGYINSFGVASPLVSSTKSLAGHSLGATGAHEAVFFLPMLRHGFVAPTVNLEEVGSRLRRNRSRSIDQVLPLETVMAFNAGLGGSNACLIFRKP